nr:hypothetical protein [Salinimonas marina]
MGEYFIESTTVLIIVLSFAAMWGMSWLDTRYHWHLMSPDTAERGTGWAQSITPSTFAPASGHATVPANNHQQAAHLQALEARVATLEALVTSQACELNQKINNL